MNRTEPLPHKDGSFVFLLKFLAFILCFVLVTALLAGTLTRFLRRRQNGISVLSESVDTAPSRLVVVLDAGHGGEDGGTSSKDGTAEKNLNLSVALLLADHLRAGGIKVVLTRDTDRLLYDPACDYKGRKKMLDQRARLEITEKAVAENPKSEVLFVSIHMNSYPSEAVRGLQVWYSSGNPNSAVLAHAVRQSAAALLGEDASRASKAAGSHIFLLHRLSTPAILIECGFLSCPAEAELLKTEKYRRDLAFTIFAAILNYSFSDTGSGGSAINESIVPLTP